MLSTGSSWLSPRKATAAPPITSPAAQHKEPIMFCRSKQTRGSIATALHPLSMSEPLKRAMSISWKLPPKRSRLNFCQSWAVEVLGDLERIRTQWCGAINPRNVLSVEVFQWYWDRSRHKLLSRKKLPSFIIHIRHIHWKMVLVWLLFAWQIARLMQVSIRPK